MKRLGLFGGVSICETEVSSGGSGVLLSDKTTVIMIWFVTNAWGKCLIVLVAGGFLGSSQTRDMFGGFG